MANKALQNLTLLLGKIKHQAAKVDEVNTKNKAHRLLEDNALFSRNLFNTNSDKFYPYALEIEKNINELKFFLSKNKNEIALNLMERIELQLSSIRTAFSSNSTIHNEAELRQGKLSQIKYKNMAKKVLLSSHQLYEKLAEYHEFERRLMEMLNQKSSQLTSGANKDLVTQESLVLHQRLGRCRQAISKVEREIEIAEKNNSL
ncbi:MAG: primosomal replication protein [Thalassotalea sp.]